MITKIKQILSILTIIGLALFTAMGLNYFFLMYLPWYISGFGVVGFTSLISYSTIYILERMR